MAEDQAYDSRDNEGYTQREWDRVVGIGKVPDEYARRIKSNEEKNRRYDRGQTIYDFKAIVDINE